MYGKVLSSNGVITLDNTNEYTYSITLDKPVEYLRIYHNNFQMLLYLNGSENGIYIDNYLFGDGMPYYEIKDIGIHSFKVKQSDITRPDIKDDNNILQFAWYGLY